MSRQKRSGKDEAAGFIVGKINLNIANREGKSVLWGMQY